LGSGTVEQKIALKKSVVKAKKGLLMNLDFPGSGKIYMIE
jgi:hypothetical protein